MLRIPLPEDDGFALAVHVKPLTDVLAFRGRSPRVTKRATHPSVHRVNSCWQCFYKGFSVPSAYSGSGMRSITLLAPSCATGQDLRPCVKKPRWQSCGVAATGKLQGSGATELATGNRERPVGHSAVSQAYRGVHFNRSGIASAKAVLLTINCSAFDHQLQCFSTPNSTAIEKRLFWGLKTGAFDLQNKRFCGCNVLRVGT